MGRLVDKGYTTFDLADHYGPAEDYVGAFEKNQRAQAAKGQVRLTMLMPFFFTFPIFSHANNK